MQSSNILEDFLLEESSLDNIIKLNQFLNLFPRNFPRSLLEDIYKTLDDQRNSTLIERIKDEIHQNFDVPLQGSIEELERSQSVRTQKESLKGLIEKLVEFEKILIENNNKFDKEISGTLDDIMKLCDRSSELDVKLDSEEELTVINMQAANLKSFLLEK